MEEKLKTTLDKIRILAEHNPVFADILQGMVLELSPARFVSIKDSENINSIYEYCIEKKIEKQAKEFYVDFPYNNLKDDLIKDFIRMEYFRRKDDFMDFSLAVYQQVECIVNNIFSINNFEYMIKGKMDNLAYVNNRNNDKNSYTVAKLLFGNNCSILDEKKELKNLTAKDKIKITIYSYCFLDRMQHNDYTSFKDIEDKLYKIYQIRNMNHRGGKNSIYQQNTIDEILKNTSQYYFLFMGVLADLVKRVNAGHEEMMKIIS